MEVITAEHAGFCFGVERAVNIVYQLIEAGETPLYTYGPIINNETVVEELEAKGVRILADDAALETAEPGTVVIRSHGVSRAVQQKMEVLGFRVEDATCPFVKKIHHLVEQAEAEGHEVLITGDPDHPEVQAICGWCRKKPTVIREAADISEISTYDSPFVVSQTTFQQKKFKEIVEKLNRNGYNAIVVNTICNATQTRQKEAEALASSVDAMIVIGGSQSSNTKKLYEICKAHCGKTYYIRTLVDLRHQGFQPVRCVGITAGASTPKKIIEEVQAYVRNEF